MVISCQPEDWLTEMQARNLLVTLREFKMIQLAKTCLVLDLTPAKLAHVGSYWGEDGHWANGLVNGVDAPEPLWLISLLPQKREGVVERQGRGVWEVMCCYGLSQLLLRNWTGNICGQGMDDCICISRSVLGNSWIPVCVQPANFTITLNLLSDSNSETAVADRPATHCSNSSDDQYWMYFYSGDFIFS